MRDNRSIGVRLLPGAAARLLENECTGNTGGEMLDQSSAAPQPQAMARPPAGGSSKRPAAAASLAASAANDDARPDSLLAAQRRQAAADAAAKVQQASAVKAAAEAKAAADARRRAEEVEEKAKQAVAAKEARAAELARQKAAAKINDKDTIRFTACGNLHYACLNAPLCCLIPCVGQYVVCWTCLFLNGCTDSSASFSRIDWNNRGNLAPRPLGPPRSLFLSPAPLGHAH